MNYPPGVVAPPAPDALVIERRAIVLMKSSHLYLGAILPLVMAIKLVEPGAIVINTMDLDAVHVLLASIV